MALEVRSSRIHSIGVFTTKSIRKGTRIVEYEGERITPEEADRRYEGAVVTYLYELKDRKTVIDGKGVGALLNHSCDPNCEAYEIGGRVWIYALRNIAAGEELVWNYNLHDDEDPAPCHCGSSNCRGTMYSEAWIKTIKRRAASRKRTKQKKSGKRKKAGLI